MKAFASLLLAVGCLWAMFVAWLFVAIEGVADTPKSLFMTWLYWCGMLIGPLALIVGSALLLRSIQSRRGLILIEIGSVILTIFALYNSVTGMQRTAAACAALLVLFPATVDHAVVGYCSIQALQGSRRAALISVARYRRCCGSPKL